MIELYQIVQIKNPCTTQTFILWDSKPRVKRKGKESNKSNCLEKTYNFSMRKFR